MGVVASQKEAWADVAIQVPVEPFLMKALAFQEVWEASPSAAFPEEEFPCQALVAEAEAPSA